MKDYQQLLLPAALLLVLTACQPATQVDFAPTETAIAAKVMTQVAESERPATPPPSPPTPAGGSPAQPPPAQTSVSTAPSEAEPIQLGQYIIAFLACDVAGGAPCNDPRNHTVYLAQSNDGLTWELVPDWVPLPGSIPDVIVRGNTLYVYYAGLGSTALVRYHLDTGVLDPPVAITITPDLPAGVVDPSLFADEEGRLVLFFLYGQRGSDPAACAPSESSCERAIGSATEVEGSDGGQFTLDNGDRISITLGPNAAFRSASDPDIFFDGQQYVLYLSHGASTSVWVSPDLRGEYTRVMTFPPGLLTVSTGGVASGYFDPLKQEYWIYAHVDKDNRSLIRRAVYSNFMRDLSNEDFVTVITGESIGLGETFSVGSPGFAVNLQTSAPPSEEQPTGMRPTPQFNPFENMTPEQETCLRDGWGDEVFEAITGFQRPPTQDEETVLFDCLNLQPPQEGGSGEGGDGGPGAMGPYFHQVMLATSPDGLTWTVNETVIRDHASVPEIVLLPDGSIMIYFVDGELDDLDAIRQGPNGEWQEVDFSLQNRPTQKAYDPDVVVLPDGRLRLFYFGPPTEAGGMMEDDHEIYSAISQDGVTFESEPGVRIAVAQVTDPSVVLLPDGSWLMALSRGPKTLLASSPNGETFTETGVVIPQGGVPELRLLPNGSLRLYVSGQGGIASLISTDGGQNWMEESGIRIPAQDGNVAADPSVIQLLDGSWLMAWKRFDPQALTPP